MTERIKLTKDDIQLRFITNTLRKIIINTNAIFQKDTNKFDEDENTKGAELYKQQILDDHEKTNRFNQIFANHKKNGVPLNIPEFTGVDQKVIDQIYNIITDVLEYVEDGKVPDGYCMIKES